MKQNILLISIIIALFVISGCITEDNVKKDTSDKSTVIVKSEDNNDKIEPKPEPTIIDEVEEIIEPITDQLDPAKMLDKELANGYTIPEDKLVALKEKVKMGSSSAFLSTSYPSGISYGEYRVYPFGLSNLNTRQKEYLINIDFVEARDSTNTPIKNLNETAILEWFKNNDFEIVTLNELEVAYIPIGVAINSDQPEGFYDFNLILSEKFVGDKKWDINQKLLFTVRVKE